MSDLDRGQVSRSAAEVYEEFFIPALLAEWTERVVDAAQVQTGQSVLDVACGTGILARQTKERVGATATVVGYDVNEGMLEVARRNAPHIEWRQGRAEDLPFEDEEFDAVISQFGLMFFDDKRAALREMFRVLKSGGRLAVAVWDSLDNTPGYMAMVGILQRLFGNEAADSLRAPFILGDTMELKTLFQEAGIKQAKVSTIEGRARFPSIESWVYTDIKGWTLADALDDEEFEQLLQASKQGLKPFVQDGGGVMFPSPAHIVTATKS